MRLFSATVAVALTLAFGSFAGAAAAHKPHTGTVVKVNGDVVVVKWANKAGAEKDHKIKTDANTKVTVDGHEAKLSDLKAGEQVSVSVSKHVATEIAASTTHPANG